MRQQLTVIGALVVWAATAAASQADLAALRADWFALASVPGTPPISAKDNSGADDSPAGDTGVPIFRVDGVTIADHDDDLWDRTIDAPLSVSEDGLTQDDATAWTGTLADGTFNPDQPLGRDPFFSGGGHIGATGDLWIGAFGSIDRAALRPIDVVSGALPVAKSTLLAGDYNDDGMMSAADSTAWRDRVGAPAGTLPSETDRGEINGDQHLPWTANFGATRSGGAAIPEPGAEVSAWFAITWLAARGSSGESPRSDVVARRTGQLASGSGRWRRGRVAYSDQLQKNRETPRYSRARNG